MCGSSLSFPVLHVQFENGKTFNYNNDFIGLFITKFLTLIPYPDETKNDSSLPPVYSQASLHIRAVRPCYIPLADQLQVLDLLFLKL